MWTAPAPSLFSWMWIPGYVHLVRRHFVTIDKCRYHLFSLSFIRARPCFLFPPLTLTRSLSSDDSHCLGSPQCRHYYPKHSKSDTLANDVICLLTITIWIHSSLVCSCMYRLKRCHNQDQRRLKHDRLFDIQMLLPYPGALVEQFERSGCRSIGSYQQRRAKLSNFSTRN